jgi:hypothetical protein
LPQTDDASRADPLVRKHRPAAGEGEAPAVPPVKEIGGRKDGTEPTRYGDWEKNGRCIDF